MAYRGYLQLFCWISVLLCFNGVQITGLLLNDKVEPSAESRLITDIISGSKRQSILSRPVTNASTPVNVLFSPALIQILDLSEKSQSLTTFIWQGMTWKDEIIAWDPKEYDGIDSIRIPSQYIWTPDIRLYNNIGSESWKSDDSVLVVIFASGSVSWIPPIIYTSSCEIEMMNYPFDTQICTLKFGSWAYDASRLDMVHNSTIHSGFNDSGYRLSSAWDLVGNTGVKNRLKYECCDEEYVDITYTIELARKFSFHVKMIIIPTFLLSSVSPALFWIPAHRPDRTSLGMSLFGSFFLLLIIVVEASPPNSDAKLGTFCCLSMVMVGAATIASVIVVNLRARKTPVSRWLKKLINVSFVKNLFGIKAPDSMEMNNDGAVTHLDVSRDVKHLDGSNDVKQYITWETVAHVVNFFLFFIYLIVLGFLYIFYFPCFTVLYSKI